MAKTTKTQQSAALGRLIRKAREKAKMSIVDLAKMTPVSESTISSIERGDIDTPSEPVIKALAKTLPISEKQIRDLLPKGAKPADHIARNGFASNQKHPQIRLQTEEVGEVKQLSKNTFEIEIVKAGRTRAKAGLQGQHNVGADVIKSAIENNLFSSMSYFIDHDDIKGNGKKVHQSARDCAGIVYNPRWSDELQAAVGTLRTLNNETGRFVSDTLIDIVKMQAEGIPTPDLGSSLTFYPKTKRSNKGYFNVENFRHVESLELVFMPATNSRHVARFSAQFTKDTNMPDEEELDRDVIAEIVAEVIADGQNNNQDPTKPTTFSAEELNQQVESQVAKRMNAELAKRDHQVLGMRLNAIEGLPEATIESIGKRFDADKPVDFGELDKLVDDAKEMFATMSSNGVQGLGNPAGMNADSETRLSFSGAPVVTITDTPREYVERSILNAMGVDVNELDEYTSKEVFSIGTTLHQLHADLTGDFEGTMEFDIAAAREKTGFHAMTGDTWGEIWQCCFRKSIKYYYDKFPKDRFEWWRKFTDVDKANSFARTKFYSTGGLSGLEHTPPGHPVAEMCDDLLKQGNIGQWYHPAGMISLPYQHLDQAETCANFLLRPKKLVQAAYMFRHLLFLKLLTMNDGFGIRLDDGQTLFHPNRPNIVQGANAHISSDAWDQAAIKMFEIEESGTAEDEFSEFGGKQLGLEPYGIITGIRNRKAAYEALVGKYEPGQIMVEKHEGVTRLDKSRICIVPNWKKAQDWIVFADKAMFPAFQFLYRYSMAPRVIKDGPGSYFTHGVYRWAIRDDFEVTVCDPRAMCKFMPGG